ncbi:DUF2303 family protein [Nonomuraea mesophila]|uniref:DUF2303 family protein n=1 Tax=Nonomuraea mesophila TaxID=2530382 RepID=UPI00140E4026|nr:DUF2303 family protein [Nonomuraea mesophila]
MNDRTENDAVIQVAQEAARAAAGATPLDIGTVYMVPTADGPRLLDLDTTEHRQRLAAPRRKTGRTVVEDVGSFLAYFRKHADADTETYVNVHARAITAVLNAPTADAPRWGDHRLILQLCTTDAWDAWAGNDRRWLPQREFTDFLEEHLSDIREPAAAELLEIATTFHAKTTVKFASATRLASGDANLVWEETTDASAGAKGNLKVPTEFKIAVKCLELPVAEGEDPVVYGLGARFRYRIERGELRVMYLLDDPAAVLRDAVLAVVGQVEKAAEITILRGMPA